MAAMPASPVIQSPVRTKHVQTSQWLPQPVPFKAPALPGAVLSPREAVEKLHAPPGWRAAESLRSVSALATWAQPQAAAMLGAEVTYFSNSESRCGRARPRPPQLRI
eukprot:CAMPEP_0171063864 /NCGR_PEP_ID=MMETSP0766_2-20121228/5938_1 /TAXON_ID=439317 /ORGANISM="Gambierdiscus australes, Strain CAWD 149" /LENGTH=106 /DNA_ID=CAMNT_0011519839 /DNA_START=127 /DNA_END=447 /DNA_ORIENTATION=+